jgi:hypothetical protein
MICTVRKKSVAPPRKYQTIECAPTGTSFSRRNSISGEMP